MPCLQASIRLVLSIWHTVLFWSPDGINWGLNKYLLLASTLQKHICTQINCYLNTWKFHNNFMLIQYLVFWELCWKGLIPLLIQASFFRQVLKFQGQQCVVCPCILSKDIGLMFFKIWNSNPVYLCAESFKMT